MLKNHKRKPIFLKYMIWPYDLRKIDIKQDKEIIITQVFNHGNWKRIKWILKTYQRKDIIKVLKSPYRGMWFKDVLNFWMTVFRIKINKEKYKLAIFNLHPVKFK